MDKYLDDRQTSEKDLATTEAQTIANTTHTSRIILMNAPVDMKSESIVC